MKKALLFIGLILFLGQLPIFAQDGFNDKGLDYMEDEGSNLWQQDTFIDPTAEDALEQSGEYIGDEEVKALEAEARRRGGPSIDIAAQLEKDKQLLPDNMMYGLATGLTIGGWFALLEGKSGRDNARYIGLGLVGGMMLGLAIGTKSVYQPLLKQQRGSLYILPPPQLLSDPKQGPDKTSLGLLSWQSKF